MFNWYHPLINIIIIMPTSINNNAELTSHDYELVAKSVDNATYINILSKLKKELFMSITQILLQKN